MYLIVAIFLFVLFFLIKRVIKQAKQVPLGLIKTVIKIKEVSVNSGLGDPLLKVTKFIGWSTKPYNFSKVNSD